MDLDIVVYIVYTCGFYCTTYVLKSGKYEVKLPCFRVLSKWNICHMSLGKCWNKWFVVSAETIQLVTVY